MSRRELTALLGFLGAVAGSVYLGWLLFSHWPGGAAFDAGQGKHISTGMTVYIFVVVALQHWRRNEPLADERDRAIDGEAAKRGFYALALLNVVAGVALHAEAGLVGQFGAEWLRFCLLWMVMVSVAVFGASQLYLYRRG